MGGEGASQAREEHARSEDMELERESDVFREPGRRSGGCRGDALGGGGRGGGRGRGLAMLRRLDLIRDKVSLQE